MKKNFTSFTLRCLMIFLFMSRWQPVSAQINTEVSGTVTDAKTHETMPGVSVMFKGTTIGTSTNSDGHFHLSAGTTSTSITFSFIGYKPSTLVITPGKPQVINAVMSEDSHLLNEVVVEAGKRIRYRNKGNPAVELIRQVIAHKRSNRLENYEFAEYHQYEKMVFYLSNLSEKFLNKGMFKNYQFLFRTQDSTEMGGKNLLPIYMEEKLSNNYFRKHPYAKKEVIEGQKQVKYDENFIDNEGLKSIFNRMYQDIDIYDNNISLLGNQLLSPIADASPSFYEFFITDTIKDVSPNLIELSFIPRNSADLLFTGKIYITMDENTPWRRQHFPLVRTLT